MSDEYDSPQGQAFEEKPFEVETTSPQSGNEERKPSGGLKFLTVLMFLLAVSVFVLPFVWGTKGKKMEFVPDSAALNNDWLIWLGNIFPFILAFTICLFVYAFLVEIIGLLSFRKFKPHLGMALGFTAIFGVAASVFGYFRFMQGDFGSAPLNLEWEENKMGIQLWIFMTFTFFAMMAFLSKLWSRHHNKFSPFYPIFMLLAGAALVFSSYRALGQARAENDVLGDFLNLTGLEIPGLNEAQEEESGTDASEELGEVLETEEVKPTEEPAEEAVPEEPEGVAPAPSRSRRGSRNLSPIPSDTHSSDNSSGVIPPPSNLAPEVETSTEEPSEVEDETPAGEQIIVVDPQEEEEVPFPGREEEPSEVVEEATEEEVSSNEESHGEEAPSVSEESEEVSEVSESSEVEVPESAESEEAGEDVPQPATEEALPDEVKEVLEDAKESGSESVEDSIEKLREAADSE